jgi:hypothetical protein
LAGQGSWQLFEQVAFRVDPKAFRRQRQGDQLFVRQLGRTGLVQEIVGGCSSSCKNPDILL